MKRTPHTRTVHPGFTLMELLVVIAIIAVLMGLILPAINKVVVTGPRTKNTGELRQLANAVGVCKARFGLDYLPSKLRLRPQPSDYLPPTNPTPNAVDRESYKILTSMFPNWRSPISWTGSPMPGADHTLEGDQCLVFFLGGIPLNGIPSGFGADPGNPGNVGPGVPVLDGSPFFTFETSRLAPKTNPKAGGKHFPVYNDVFEKKPYIYFSNYGTLNGYHNGDAFFGVDPYREGPGRFYNPQSFQIISAGADGQFGPGGHWLPASPGPSYAYGQPGYDDQSNFYDKMLGISP